MWEILVAHALISIVESKFAESRWLRKISLLPLLGEMY